MMNKMMMMIPKTFAKKCKGLAGVEEEGLVSLKTVSHRLIKGRSQNTQ
jgi:hypothetical protein